MISHIHLTNGTQLAGDIDYGHFWNRYVTVKNPLGIYYRANADGSPLILMRRYIHNLYNNGIEIKIHKSQIVTSYPMDPMFTGYYNLSLLLNKDVIDKSIIRSVMNSVGSINSHYNTVNEQIKHEDEPKKPLLH